jgi:fructose-bisphosphate aldolase class II
LSKSVVQTDEKNIAVARPYIERAKNAGIAVEVELGRLEGGEAGLRMISDAKLTDPKKAETFIREHVAQFTTFTTMTDVMANRSGANILAPSIGNLHGSYLNPPNFRQEM